MTRNKALPILTVVAALLLAHCESGSEPPDQSTDDGSDRGDVAVVDAPLDEADVVADSAADTTVADVLDGAEDVPDIPAPPLPDDPCPDPPAGDAPPMGRWSLSLFHYNVQYVAGGTEDLAAIGFAPGGNVEGLELTAEEVEDRIITESLVPVLAILERNPELALTFEMQGYMVDVIAERHPRTLTRMRALVDAEQLELASVHWSDQFFLAFGRAEMDESWARTQASFAAAGLQLSRVVFTQEGQFGEGFAAWLSETRPEAIVVMARNLQGFFQDDLVDQPLWDVAGVDVVLPRGLADERVDRRWSFFDDGELLATNDMNPYLGELFAYHPPSTGRYEHRLKCEAENGYTVGRISDYAVAVREAGFEPLDMPPFLDGTWQPRSTTGPLRWMGGAGDVWSKHERDNEVLTTCVGGRHHVLALDTLAKSLGDSASATLLDALDQAWRNLLWGEVSDARGVNPWWGEVQYGLDHCGAAMEIARTELLAEAENRSTAWLAVDTRDGTIEERSTDLEDPTRSPTAAPIEAIVAEAGGRIPSLDWYRLGAAEDGLWLLEVSWPPVEGADTTFTSCMNRNDDLEWKCSVSARPIAIDIPREPGFISYRPALGDTLVEYTEADFSLQGEAYEDGVWSTVSDGLVGLGSAFLVKDVRSVHLAIGWPPGDGNNHVIQVRDETLQPWASAIWRFWYTEDNATAVDLAERNLRPIVSVGIDE